jgi:hypothetical protein
MKVLDIITESLILNENPVVLLALERFLASRVPGTALPALEAAISKFASSLVGKSASAAEREVAETVAASASKLGVSVDEAGAWLAPKLRAGGLSDDVINAGIKRAGSTTSGRVGNWWAGLKDDTARLNFWYAGTMSTINKILLTLGISKPIFDAVVDIMYGYEQKDKGNPEFQGNKLQAYVTLKMHEAVMDVIALGVGQKVFGGLFGKYGIQALPFGGWSVIGGTFNALQPAAKAAFMVWIQSEPGQKAFAEWLTGNALLGGPAFKELTYQLNGLIKGGYDKILREMGSDKAQQVPDAKDLIPSAPLKNKEFDWATGRYKNSSI